MNFSLARKLTAEALGTFILVATVVGSGIMAETLTTDTAVALWGNTAATGAILVVLIFVLGPVSGAHFNPAVTFAFALRREITLTLAALYVLVQITGGILGTFFAHVMFEDALVQVSLHQRAGLSQWMSEGAATFALLMAIFGTLKFRPEAVPVAVGLVITAGYWWTSSTSFANPAVTIARSLTDTFSGIQPDDVPMFIVAQLVSAALATFVFGWLLQEITGESESRN